MLTDKQIKRLESLKNKHKMLDNDIKEMYSKNYAEEEITLLKKKKLKFKDEIERLTTLGEINGKKN